MATAKSKRTTVGFGGGRGVLLQRCLLLSPASAFPIPRKMATTAFLAFLLVALTPPSLRNRPDGVGSTSPMSGGFSVFADACGDDNHHHRHDRRKYRVSRRLTDNRTTYNHPFFTDEYIREELALAKISNATLEERRRLLDRLLESNPRLPCAAPHPSETDVAEMGKAHADWERSHPHENGHRGRYLQTVKYVIPVFFHVAKGGVHKQVGLSKSNRQRFMNVLNRGFRDSPFWFVCKGQKTQTLKASSWTLAHLDNFRKATRIPRADTLNVYVVNTDALQKGTVGMSHYPPIVRNKKGRFRDGVVIMNPSLGVFHPSNVYNGIVHETGHFLGLAHTFEGGCSSSKLRHYGKYPRYVIGATTC